MLPVYPVMEGFFIPVQVCADSMLRLRPAPAGKNCSTRQHCRFGAPPNPATALHNPN
jgi:hypothetical protein